jgi:hypothetical protein
MASASSGDELLRELPHHVQQAREYALLGGYTTSLVYFDRALSTLTRYMRHLVDGGERARWSRVKEDLNGEMKLVKELMRVLAVFKSPPGGGGGAATAATAAAGAVAVVGVSKRGVGRDEAAEEEATLAAAAAEEAAAAAAASASFASAFA